jgi:hypothetical protein
VVDNNLDPAWEELVMLNVPSLDDELLIQVSPRR